MYGVFWTTPPQMPATMVARASVSRMSRVRYRSPATMALSVLSIPPMTVATAKGMATDRAPHVGPGASSHARVGQGIASRQATGPPNAAEAPPPVRLRSSR